MKRRTFLQWLSASGAAGLSQAVLGGSGCAPEAPAPDIDEGAAKDPAGKGYNLVICVFDSLRGDHLGCYGYSRDTSPFIDEIARQSVVFERAYSNSSYTRESVPVIWSGLAPTRSGSTGWHARQPAGIPNLSTLFKPAGYKTALISNQPAVYGTFLHRNAAFDTVAEVKAGDNQRVQDLLNRRPQQVEINADEYLARLTEEQAG